MEWPLAMGHNLDFDQCQPVEQLWPDRKGGSGKRRRRQASEADDDRNGEDESRNVRARIGYQAQHEFLLCDGDDLGNGMEFVLNEDEDPWNEFFST